MNKQIGKQTNKQTHTHTPVSLNKQQNKTHIYSCRMQWDKRKTKPQTNAWSFGLCECFGGPDCAEVMCCALMCPCVLYGQVGAYMVG